MFELLNDSPLWQNILQSIQNRRPLALYDMTESQRAFLSCAIATLSGRQVLYVASSEQACLRAAEDCSAWLGGKSAAFLPDSIEFVPGASSSRESRWQRMSVLYSLYRQKTRVLCVPADALMLSYPPPHSFLSRTLTLKPGDEQSPQTLIEQFVQWGYERVEMVEGKGQCALRGEILDIYPPLSENALRIEFFDTEIDSIRTFDCMTQRSADRLNEAALTLAAEYLFEPQDREAASNRMLLMIEEASQPDGGLQNDRLPAPSGGLLSGGYRHMLRDAEMLKDRGTFDSIQLWSSLLNPDCVPFEAWLDDPIVVIDTPDRVKMRFEDRHKGFLEDLKSALMRGDALPCQAGLLSLPEDTQKRLSKLTHLTMQELLRGMAGFEPGETIQIKGVGASQYQGRFRQLADEIKAMAAKDFAVCILSGTSSRSDRIGQALQEYGCYLPKDPCQQDEVVRGKPCFLPLALSHGFIVESLRLAIITDGDLYGRGNKKARNVRKVGERIEAFTELSEGDYVVHDHHGIGVYKGTVRLQSEGTYRDYLLIQYRGTDKLYVPTDQFNRVQKYIGGQGEAPSLNDLSSNAWSQQKKKVRASLKKLAFNLVELYARRQKEHGFSFAPEPAWEAQFDENFEYDLTQDQEHAVTDILNDMHKDINMDRLLCGDVGYGKTEVAMRAAFRAVMNNKQVAVLAPTTVLVQQHDHNFKKRFAGFAVQIGSISRFRTTKENKETLRRLAEGKIDILIGTHRLLSKDVSFRELGLLIVDEEQRFGVAHKEIIKNMKQTIDVLTLSATPIPRTLHMSMVGVRDMSLLETPPEERFPVQTYVVDYSEGLVRDAILRETARGGQVFFLYNKVQNIDRFCAQLKAAIPEVSIAVAHGQMRDNALEDVMLDFSQGKFDVLLCSTIIENGIDIPLANTLIVYDADRFGLSQLYQLRGRVGRSNRLAYAYFTVHPDKSLSEGAEKRLAAIKEFTEFGAGFRIAMRDLEIRGAGNIFGPEQSGQISTIGYDLYCKMIEEAVREARGDSSLQSDDLPDTRVDLLVNAFLPESYVNGQVQRIEVYKRIAMIASEDDRLRFIDDLIDRFGEPPSPVVNLIYIAQLRALASALGIDLVTHSHQALHMRLSPKHIKEPEKLVACLTQADQRFSLQNGAKPALLLKLNAMDDEQALYAAIHALTKLNQQMGYAT